ncbi:cysteine--tRNA ligase, cytoplasmic [Acyrthosiphon pisum]|uniref:Cysteine--tRNA ligase, cytoplasmic n=1 Tax=Acyrthosiphon pisum TaxID=7029 RepID=A0A8R2H972_ACYPI|nr:cysteine--tRNA ligase, cytoplasmic [Acyrthosiphon pisum]XP_016661760.1 cysteine--tRNA ligase, cytoplasmic [Acyrthosiphon pisum]|eukprot:XP_016661759.1 PREDICTED: cysteine--tRNA ligase, cytoplasmic [Acyrthosiphon pisum]
MAKRSQPAWSSDKMSDTPRLKLFNSLTRKKEIFIPKNGNKVHWYSCGPTVYDASHMGHARSYITFDILRRVLKDYFHYDVEYVMNITDIDDKIIKRARQLHLFEEYVKTATDKQIVQKDIILALGDLKKDIEQMDPDKKVMTLKAIEKLTSISQLIEGSSLDDIKLALNEIKDPLGAYLDTLNSEDVPDNSIFESLPRFWESNFHSNMSSLNILPPDKLSRVSEYVPETIAYIETIIKNGYAYESNGSVYFDVAAFDSQPIHHYAKLVPEAYGDSKSLQDGEGDLTTSAVNEKRSPNDFALWKKSKKGEPWWDSPWGKGRPGWHIECSVMASCILGQTLDIHTGGIDLKFPHHDNEIAQAEAYYNNEEWVRYFLHSGHLTISGCKMSKSLKNFITIEDALKNNTSRQLRLAFLLHSWKDTLDYSESTMESAMACEKLLNEFFLNVKNVTRRNYVDKLAIGYSKWLASEIELSKKFSLCKLNVHAALCDNIDTKAVLEAIRECISACNVYLRDCTSSAINHMLLLDIAKYITEILKVFGIKTADEIGFPVSEGNSSNDVETIVTPYLNILSDFRDSVRAIARSIGSKDILILCDKLRDETLPDNGVRLEDADGKPTAIKFVGREAILREKKAKAKAEADKLAEKEKKKKEQDQARAKKEELKKIHPKDLFKLETDKYSEFDENGLPTIDSQGNKISKGLTKKLQKIQSTHAAQHKEYLESIDKI